MLDSLKRKIWEFLAAKDISLVMLIDSDGHILWHKGRSIAGKSVWDGDGFSKSYIQQVIQNNKIVEEEDVIVQGEKSNLSYSADFLKIKSLIILPISDDFCLYVDSGVKKAFTETDRELFKLIGSLLSEMIDRMKSGRGTVDGLSGDGAPIREIMDRIVKYSIEESPVLLLGETGVGKTRVAELIHQNSGRSGAFITINTPSIPEALFESELFGHRKGAFTDAHSDKLGYVNEAAGGTIFFDEIAEVPLIFQAKLLRFIESQKFFVLGDSQEKQADVRIIAATNKDLGELIEKAEFREDLYFRLHVLEIEIPPLRERPEDIKALVSENRKLLKGKGINEDFWERMLSYQWPGNIRELLTVLVRLGIHGQDPLSAEDVDFILNRSAFRRSESAIGGEKLTRIRQAFEKGGNFWDHIWEPFLDRELNRSEVVTILKSEFSRHQHSLKRMSESMGVKENEFKRFVSALHKYRIHPNK